ncbi:MAG: hypothetical protein JST41_01475 [Bacteroidetes bacterium]|nr:hypothetical protein [Bacteroidota bacterium]HMU15697.1 hypothetical protein [Flavobacteriales bacterium]HNO05633.1 hypothetical protein [Flavobacteriales bacterium]
MSNAEAHSTWTGRPWKVAALVLGHTTLAFLSVQMVHWHMTGMPVSWSDLMHFDAEHYAAIASGGYVPFRQAFFPLMPKLWQVLGGSIPAICIVNGLTYIAALTWLAWRIRVGTTTLLLFLCIPNAFYFFIPYTESLFFAFAVLTIIGLLDRSAWKVAVGLFLCSVTRPTFTTLLPAILLAVHFTGPGLNRDWRTATLCIVSCLMGIFFVSMTQHADTGEWLGFYHAQSGWGNKLRLPTFPLRSWGGNDVVRLDAVAMLIGSAGAAPLFITGMRWPEDPSHPTRVVLLSFFSLFMVTMLVLVLRGGELFSLNRFIFATPFFLVMLNSVQGSVSITGWRWLWLFLVLEAYFLMFGSFVHIQTFLWFSAVVGFLMIVVAATMVRPMVQWAKPLAILIAFIVQIGFTVKFLLGGWVA